MNLRKPFCWAMLFSQIGMASLVVAAVHTDGFAGITAVQDLALFVAGRLPGGPLHDLFVSISNFVTTWWFLIFAAFFGICTLAAYIYVLLFGPPSLWRRALWLVLFWFVGFIAIPAYFARELYLLRALAA